MEISYNEIALPFAKYKIWQPKDNRMKRIIFFLILFLTLSGFAYAQLPSGYAVEMTKAEALLKAGKPEEALTTLRRPLAINPQLSPAYSLMAVIYFQQKKYAEAIPHFKQVLEFKPEAHFSSWLLALSYEAEKQPDAAIAALEHLLKYTSDFSQAINELALLYAYKGERERALQQYQKLLKLNPGLAESLKYKLGI